MAKDKYIKKHWILDKTLFRVGTKWVMVFKGFDKEGTLIGTSLPRTYRETSKFYFSKMDRYHTEPKEYFGRT